MVFLTKKLSSRSYHNLSALFVRPESVHRSNLYLLEFRIRIKFSSSAGLHVSFNDLLLSPPTLVSRDNMCAGAQVL